MTFEFDLEENGLTLESAVYQALGAASMCWESLGGAGVFQSDEAKEIGEKLVDWIKGEEKPKLGLATTRELLEELGCRIEIDYFSGGGGLEYTTVNGRPSEPPQETLRSYLDNAIRSWREKREAAMLDGSVVNTFQYDQASDYIDAFQSVRKSMLGELLPPSQKKQGSK